MSARTLLDDTILKMVLAYPSLYGAREFALSHLFCCIGTGIEWVKTEKGYVLNGGDSHENDPEKFKKGDTKEYKAYMRKHTSKAWWQELKKTHDMSLLPTFEGYYSWYPLSHYSPVFTLLQLDGPVEESFMCGAIEVLARIMEVRIPDKKTDSKLQSEYQYYLGYSESKTEPSIFGDKYEDNLQQVHYNNGFANALLYLYLPRFGLDFWKIFDSKGKITPKRVLDAWRARQPPKEKT